MKKYKLLLLSVSFALVGSLASCAKWLEVPIEGQSTSDEVFVESDGFRSALNGLYKEMAEPKLYGKELSFAFVDFLSNQYKVLGQDFKNDLYKAVAYHDYQYSGVIPLIDDIWLQAYKTIAASNDLIANVERADVSLFPGGRMEKDLILGEAKAVRAYLHFDILRLFAPAPIHDDGNAYVPFVDRFPEINARRMPVREVLTRIITEMEEARELVKAYDTTNLGYSSVGSGDARFHNQLLYGTEGYGKEASLDAFYLGRGYRMSYHAITALLARIYMYNLSFDEASIEKAMAYADEVINFNFMSLNGDKISPFLNENFSFRDPNAFGPGSGMIDPENLQDVRMLSTLIFGVYSKHQYRDANIEGHFPREQSSFTGGSMLVVDYEQQKFFYRANEAENEANEDYRFTNLMYLPKGGYNTYLSSKWYPHLSENVRDKTITIIPIIRTSELRYILSEGYARKRDYTKAYEILNEMRGKRGLPYEKALPVQSDLDSFLKDFVRENQREWISEGQLFYLYKRLDVKFGILDKETNSYVVRALTPSEASLPLPVVPLQQ